MNGAATARAAPARNAQALISAFKAPLLERILGEPESEQRQVILDLGAPSQVLLDCLSARHPCRVEIADFAGTGGLSELGATEFLEERGRAGIRDLLPTPKDPLDLILFWDLPNYLSLAAFRELCAVLSDRAAPGCRLHMLIAYSRREMPAAPARYTLRKDGQLTQTCHDDSLCNAPRYSPEDLGLAVGGFRYERGILLANGMQEFIYAWPR